MNAFNLYRYVARRNASVVCVAMGLLLLLASPAAVFAQRSVVTSAAESAPAFVPAAGAGASANWAGYVAADPRGTYTAVLGSWVVPTVGASTTSGMAANATWVGIGGVASHDLIQAGTQAIVEDGQVSYQAWYELLPEFQTRIPLAVHGGDSVHVSLEEVSPDNWQLIFLNTTTGQKYVRTLAYESSRSSAEWVEEMPLGVMGQRLGYLPLTNFGTTEFREANATVNGEKVAGNPCHLLLRAKRCEQ
jgi:hypothetical protein